MLVQKNWDPKAPFRILKNYTFLCFWGPEVAGYKGAAKSAYTQLPKEQTGLPVSTGQLWKELKWVSNITNDFLHWCLTKIGEAKNF